MKKSMLIMAMILTTHISQGQLNDYKYIVVPKIFDCFEKVNQYQTSTLVKHLFASEGFQVVYDDALPIDLKGNSCLGLRAELSDASTMFTTKTRILLVDCDGKTVMESWEGRSKSKAYTEAYAEAIRQAFDTFKGLAYSYQEKQNTPVSVSFKNDVKHVPKNAPDTSVLEQSTSAKEQTFKKMDIEESSFKKGEAKTVEQKATEKEQLYKDRTPTESNFVAKGSPQYMGSILYAQKIDKGYQVVDATPKVVLKLLSTSRPEVFIAKAGDSQGIVYQEGGKWCYERYQGDSLVKEEVDLKF